MDNKLPIHIFSNFSEIGISNWGQWRWTSSLGAASGSWWSICQHTREGRSSKPSVCPFSSRMFQSHPLRKIFRDVVGVAWTAGSLLSTISSLELQIGGVGIAGQDTFELSKLAKVGLGISSSQQLLMDVDIWTCNNVRRKFVVALQRCHWTWVCLGHLGANVRAATRSLSFWGPRGGQSGQTRWSHVFKPVVLFKFSSTDSLPSTQESIAREIGFYCWEAFVMVVRIQFKMIIQPGHVSRPLLETIRKKIETPNHACNKANKCNWTKLQTVVCRGFCICLVAF